MALTFSRSILWSTSLIAGAVATCSTAAHAQQASPPADSAAPAQPAKASADSTQIQDIIVTAQKRSENLQKASVSVNVAGAEDLNKSGVRSATDLQDIIPNVKFTAADELTVNIRGLGTADLNGGVDSAVAYVQDGVYLSHPAALAPLMFDMQRVEVLLGPQGTLYGRNSNGGVINFITADPEFTLGGHMQVGYGNYNAITSDVALNVPLTDQWAFRLSFGSEIHDPYQSDGSYDSHSYAARAKLLYKPNANLTVLLAADYSSHHSTGTSYGWVCPPGIVSVPACAGVNNPPWSGMNPIIPGVSGNSDKIWGVSATVNYDMDWATLTSITAYKQYDFQAATSPGLIDGEVEFEYHHNEKDYFFTQEVRLASPAGSKVKWVAGLYYSNEVQPYSQVYNYVQGTMLQLFAGMPNGFYQYFPFTDTSYTSAAAFANVTIPLLDNLRIRAGARETEEIKDATGQIITGVTGGGLLAPTQINPLHQAGPHFTWSAGLDWDVTSRNLFYATVSTGYKSGGLNNLPAASGLTTYAPEKVTAVEIGLKNRFFNNRLQINLNLFHYHYEGYQTFLFYQPTGGDLAGDVLFPTVNSQTATFEGGEIQGIWKLTRNDRLTFGYNYLHDRYGTFVVELPYAPVMDLSGTKVPQTPESTFSVGLDHTFYFHDGWSLNIGANTQISSSYLAGGSYTQGSGATAYYTQGAYHKTNLTATLVASGGWTLSAFVRNIENKVTINTVAAGYPVPSNLPQVNALLDPPRTYGVTLRKDF